MSQDYGGCLRVELARAGAFALRDGGAVSLVGQVHRQIETSGQLAGEAFAAQRHVVGIAVGMHRPAEFNKGHVPAFMAGAPAQDWAVVYPFVRSHEWYLLPDADRRALLVEHGRMGREYERVLSNTVAAFALGDYEWILALEGPELHEIVDLMRHLRGSGARRHVRLETPFYPGRLVTAAEALDVLR